MPPPINTTKNSGKNELRKQWQRARTPQSKRILNAKTQELKERLNNNKNDCIQTFLSELKPTEDTDYSLWRATKRIKQVTNASPPIRTRQGTWVRSNEDKVRVFAEHLSRVFQPHPSENKSEDEVVQTQILETPYQLEPPSPRIKIAEKQRVIKTLHPKKAPEYDLITGRMPYHGIKHLTNY